jgi:hypothetical protein
MLSQRKRYKFDLSKSTQMMDKPGILDEVYLSCTLRDKECVIGTRWREMKIGGMGGAWDMALHSDIEHK